MARVVARWADEWNVWSTPETWAPKRAAFDEALAAEDRDPDHPAPVHPGAGPHRDPKAKAKAAELNAGEVHASVGPPRNWSTPSDSWAEAGLDELIIPDFTLGDLSRTTDTLDLLSNEVLASFR